MLISGLKGLIDAINALTAIKIIGMVPFYNSKDVVQVKRSLTKMTEDQYFPVFGIRTVTYVHRHLCTLAFNWPRAHVKRAISGHVW